ncbi:MAG: NAD(P)-dependent oxidoreductase, partial [Burkholderiaceae bacterium]|nr:NAD(P)-dependent oxidoreductase [Burkholderiaceae bacterium]
MSTPNLPDVRPGRLSSSECASRFAQAATPPLTPSQALLEAERCLYCFDAPCASACPTGIDIPSFIRRIADGNERGAARQILEANPLGGLCARVCPTEDLCEKVCVRNTQTGVPVAIGRLQRHATDALMASSRPQVFTRAAPTGKRLAVVGAGPAGLACAHTLARHGHDVTVFDAHAKPGGLNEYGLATYKVADNFAQREVQWLLDIGGITLQPGWVLATAAQLQTLQQDFDAVFLGVGLADTHRLGVPGEDLGGVQDAVDFIATLRQAADKATVPVGRRVVVIGGGMTAVDAAVQSKLLGAESVTLVYRRGQASMSASQDEQDWALKHGVVIQHWLAPAELQGNTDGHVAAVRFARQAIANGKLAPTGDTLELPADLVLKAIGQTLGNAWLADTGLADFGLVGNFNYA